MKRYYTATVVAATITVFMLVFACQEKIETHSCFSHSDYMHVPVDFDLNVMICPSNDCDIPTFMARAQMAADSLSWRTFIAINWPEDGMGKPDSTKCLGQTNDPTVWQSWEELADLFGDGNREISMKRKSFLSSYNRTDEAGMFDSDMLLFDSENRELNTFQANKDSVLSKWPVVDQNGNKTYFQTFYNPVMTDYIKRANIKSLEGVKLFTGSFPEVDRNISLRIGGHKSRITRIHFPLYIKNLLDSCISVDLDEVKDSIVYLKESNGSIMVKAAWKIIGMGDDSSRFFTRDAVINEKHGTVHVKVGLVAMHIAIKYTELPQWLWSTFEHVDNVPEMKGHRVIANSKKKYSYYNTIYGDSVNKSPDASGKARLARLRGISKNLHMLNSWIHNQMRKINPNSVWQYYDMVGSQWPTEPNIYPMSPNYTSVEEPRYLANTVIENFAQNSSCMNCHKDASVFINVDTTKEIRRITTNFAMGFQRLNKK